MCISTLTRVYGWGRAALGLAALFAPGPVGEVAGLGDDDRAQMATRLIGGRDLFMGLGIVLGDRRGHARGWLEAAVAVDAIDAAVTADATRRGLLAPSQASLLFPLIIGSISVGALLIRHIEKNGESDASTARARLKKVVAAN